MKKVFAILVAAVMVLSLCGVVSAEEPEEAFATVEALQFDRLPEIDGKVTVEEWGQPTVAHIKYPENPQTDVSKDDQTDVEFTIWFRYTYDGFYVAAQTPDTSPCNDNVDGAQIWNGDCLQMRLDPNGCTEDQGLFPSASRNANYSEDFQEFAFAYCTDDGECYAYCWTGIMSGLALQSEGGKYGAANDGTTTTYEVYIPWDELVYDAPHAGMSYGIAAALLTATEGENDNKWQNWLEWGSGVINNRDDNICGTNRLIMTDKTVFGGASLVDPNPDAVVTTKAPVPEAEGDVVLVDVTKLSSDHAMHHSNNDDGSVLLTFDESNDPYITLNISSQVKIKAEDYPYFAMVMKNNYPYASGEIFYATSDGVADFTGGYSMMYDYYEAEGNQVAVAELGEGMGYEGYVLKLRLDVFDGGTSEPDETEVTLLYAGFFKNYEDALMFRAEGVNADLDPEYVKEISSELGENTGSGSEGQAQTDPVTTEPSNDTESGAVSENVTENAVTTGDETTGSTGKQSGGIGKYLPLIIAGAVVAVAAVVIVIVLVLGKKKKK